MCKRDSWWGRLPPAPPLAALVLYTKFRASEFSQRAQRLRRHRQHCLRRLRVFASRPRALDAHCKKLRIALTCTRSSRPSTSTTLHQLPHVLTSELITAFTQNLMRTRWAKWHNEIWSRTWKRTATSPSCLTRWRTCAHRHNARGPAGAPHARRRGEARRA